MDKRYQVFVSSTFEDLREERSAVIGALLQLDCIPAGMELFPAADDDSWTLIKSVIDDCDYYVVIVAGRYGSTPPGSSTSFTRMEYEYANEKGKPTIALIHSKPGDLAASKCEQSEERRKHLDEFRAELKKKNCRLWADRAELVSAVFTGVQHLKKTRPAVGWVRSTELPEAAKDELLRLRGQVDELTSKLAGVAQIARPEGTEELAQGPELTRITFDHETDRRASADICWGDIVRAVLPQTFGGGANPDAIAGALFGLVSANIDYFEPKLDGSTLSRSDYGKVMNQLVALGLIEPRPHPEQPGVTLWFATPYGQKVGARAIAIKSGQDRPILNPADELPEAPGIAENPAR